jgi:predicted metal-dependent hydrolase
MFDDPALQLPLWSDRDATDGWVLRESRRARRLAVRVFHSGRVEVVVPPRTSTRAVEQFIAGHRAWIERKRAAARRNAAPAEPFPPERIELEATGEVWRVHLSGGAGRLRVRAAAPYLLRISGNAADATAVRVALRRWLLKRATEILLPQLAACAREADSVYRRALVRRQRTRWGSCSARGTISLNCCLVFQRPAVVHYLLLHELAHVHHMNHSARFWQWVARRCPDCRRLDRELLDGWRRVPSWVFGDSGDAT